MAKKIQRQHFVTRLSMKMPVMFVVWDVLPSSRFPIIHSYSPVIKCYMSNLNNAFSYK
jgi:hypothetical protein